MIGLLRRVYTSRPGPFDLRPCEPIELGAVLQAQRAREMERQGEAQCPLSGSSASRRSGNRPAPR